MNAIPVRVNVFVGALNYRKLSVNLWLIWIESRRWARREWNRPDQ